MGRYYTGMPVIANVTILNGMGVTGKVIGEPRWIPVVKSASEVAEFLEISFRWSETLWPWYIHSKSTFSSYFLRDSLSKDRMDSCILKSESKSCEMARNYSRSC
jgi:hypothetical protein